MKRLIAILALCLSSAPFAFGATLHYGPTSTGSGLGTDCSNTAAVSSLVGSVGGVGILCANTYTGAANTELIDITTGGVSGNPYTLECSSATANSCVVTAPYWSNNAAIRLDSVSWVTLNLAGFVIKNSANGTGLTYAQPSTGVTVNGGSNILVENGTVIDICQHTSTSDTTGCIQGGNGDQCMGIVGGATNVTITGMTLHDCQAGVTYDPQNGDSNVSITNNTISRVNWGIGGGLNSGSISGLTITGNDITCVIAGACNWYETADNFHHNGVMLFPQAGDENGVVVADNWIHDINGNTTAGIFLDPSGTADLPGVQIFNNVLTTTSGQSGPANAQITVGQGVSGAKVYNNTIAGPATQGISGQVSPTFKNNIVTGPAYGIDLNSGYSGVVSDYGDYYSNSGGFAAGSAIYSTLAAWVSATGFDPHSIATNPNLTSSFTLNSGSPAIGTGQNLYSLGIAALDTGAPATFGAGGGCGSGCVPRPTSGPWDMGAYPSSGGTPTVATPSVSPVSGSSYTTPQTVTISDSTSGATICYTTDGSTPTANGTGTCTHGTTYSTSFSQSIPTYPSTVTVKAIGSKSGYSDSGVGFSTYSASAIPPTNGTPVPCPVCGFWGKSAFGSLYKADF